jgi:orotate phosphoribosyltransferase-like protein
MVTMKTDENVEKIRTLIRTDHCLVIRMIAEELKMDRETVRQILTTNLNMKKVCAKMVPKNLPVFSWKTNTSTRTDSVLSQIFPCVTFLISQN